MAEEPSNPTDFIAPALEELTPLFPAYELEAFIAQGGMGAVYKARQKSLDRSVAIKILPREFGDDPQFRASFEAEAKAMARLNHPNLISVYDFGDIEGMLYIVMEFVHGKALYYSAHNKAIDPMVALDMVSTISRGLAHAHRGGIIHRDIKPANILLDADAKPKVGDFGLAQPVDRAREEGVIFGTPGYTAPEIFQEGADVDARSDIFSVGALLYELLCGRHPEPHSHGMTTGIDPRIDTILKKATHADPKLRYADVDQLADDLDNLIPKLSGPKFATAPSVSGRSPLNPQPALASSQQKSGGLAFLIFFMLILGGGAAAYYLLRDNPEAPQVENPDEEAEPKKESDKKPGKEQDRSDPKKRPKEDPMAQKDTPNEPKPSEEKPQKLEETPTQSLNRLAETLREGDRSEFPLKTVKREKTAHFLVDQNMTWDDANNFARNHGAHLAILTTSEDLKWFHENFKNPSPVWLGASDSGFESKWYWTNGSPVAQAIWLAGSPDNRSSDNANGEDFAAISPMSPNIEDHHRFQRFAFLLEWCLDGTAPASIDAQLAKTGEALNNKRTPIFPAGTYNVGGSRFLLLKRILSWEDASTIASNAGGHLAVPSNDKEAAFIALTLKDTLDDNASCWLGGQRDKAFPEIWKYVTGEAFTYINWLEGQPDNFDDNEPCLAIKSEKGKLGANDEGPNGNKTTHFLIEWSVPALRNMPKASALDIGGDKLLAALEEIRGKIRNRHGRDYRKFRREYDKVVQGFLKDTIAAIDDMERLPEPIKAGFVAEIQKYLDKNELPDNLPAGAPGKMQRDLEDAREEAKTLKEEYETDYQKAKEDYLDTLLNTSKAVLKKGEAAKGKMFVLENTVTKDNDDRFDQIMDNKKVPLPEEPAEEEDEKDEE